MIIPLPYGRETLTADIPDHRICGVIHSQLDDFHPAKSQVELVQEAVSDPIESPLLRELAQNKEKVVILASDHTRPVPSKVIIPIMLEEIRRGNPSADVTILIATGSHRETTKFELEGKFGSDIVSREKILIHDCEDDDNLVFVDTLPSGGKLILNRLVVEADLLVAEGFIEPHFFAGYSGGRKSVLPGCAAKATVHANHCADFIAHPSARSGCLEENPIHRDMIFAARRANLAYIVNVVINSKQEVIGAFAGDCDKAHLAGCKFLSSMALSKAQPADIVVTSNNGYPLDQNLYQAVKGMTTAEATCKEGGIIIIVARCEDGVGGDGFYKLFQQTSDISRIMERFLQTPMEETVPDQWQAQIFARILLKHSVILVSDLPNKLVQEMHMIPAPTVQQAIFFAEAMLCNKEASITVIPEGISSIIV